MRNGELVPFGQVCRLWPNCLPPVTHVPATSMMHDAVATLAVETGEHIVKQCAANASRNLVSAPRRTRWTELVAFLLSGIAIAMWLVHERRWELNQEQSASQPHVQFHGYICALRGKCAQVLGKDEQGSCIRCMCKLLRALSTKSGHAVFIFRLLYFFAMISLSFAAPTTSAADARSSLCGAA